MEGLQGGRVSKLAFPFLVLLLNLLKHCFRQEHVAIVLVSFLGHYFFKFFFPKKHRLLMRVVKAIDAKDTDVLKKEVLVGQSVEIFAYICNRVVCIAGSCHRKGSSRIKWSH
jgi:hypothetical protein